MVLHNLFNCNCFHVNYYIYFQHHTAKHSYIRPVLLLVTHALNSKHKMTVIMLANSKDYLNYQ